MRPPGKSSVAVAVSDSALAAGEILHGTYEIVRRAASGGMGDLYEARHKRLSGRYAVKVLRESLPMGSAAVARFRREAEIASSLQHPNIVSVMDFNVLESGAPYIVMEFLDGVDLGAEIERVGRFPVRRCVAIVEQISAALAAAHRRGIVHRDLKPQNVFLLAADGTMGDRIKLLDFGISKMVTAAPLTGDAALMGTPHYMSPEQAEGKVSEVDGRTDQFALAAMTYEMLAGRRPFTGDSVPAILLAVTAKEPRRIGEVTPEIPDGVDAVVRKGMAKDKEKRFLAVEEFGRALVAAAGGGTEAGERSVGQDEIPTLVPTSSKASARFGPRQWTVVLALGIGGVGGAVWFSSPGATGADPPAEVAPARTPPALDARPTAPAIDLPATGPAPRAVRGVKIATSRPRMDGGSVQPVEPPAHRRREIDRDLEPSKRPIDVHLDQPR